MLLNVIENALKYSPEGSVVRVEAEVSRDLRGGSDGELLKLRVSDAGDGIPADDLKRVFRPFVRLDANRAVARASGSRWYAALSTCAMATLRFARGRKGTTVFVTLPLMPGETPERCCHDVRARATRPPGCWRRAR